MNFGVVVEGIENIHQFRRLGKDIELAAVRAVNTTARSKRTRAAKLIGGQLNVPKSYLSPAGGRLAVVKQATRTSPEAVIRARGRPTSLARYATTKTINKAGVRVKVGSSQTRFLKRAFLIKLPGKGGDVDTQGNLGLAVRVKPGERISNKIRQVQVSKGLYLLYGPSVQQVFLDNQGNGVANDMTKETLRDLEAEFLRLLKL
jgi:hypothetical protein